MFGDKQAPGTMYWSSKSLVCLLPLSEVVSIVPVTIKASTWPLSGSATWTIASNSYCVLHS